ncbi:PAS domain S-box-containing protein [Bradyrhizobium sp. USDA 4011]
MPALARVPSEIIKKWQEIVDLLAEIMHVPSAVVMRVEPSNSEVAVASDCKPSEAGSRYCETVMKTGRPLLVPDARRDERWKSSPDIKRGMVSYLGVPISWPNGEIFGTICVYDNKSNEYSQLYLRQLLLCRDVLQNDLRTLATLHSQLEQHEAKIRRLVDANIMGIIIWDLEGHILEANDAFLRMGGYDREDLISGRLNRTDLTPPEWRERDARTDAELKLIGAVQPFEKEYFRKDGGRVPVLIGLAAFGEERHQGVAFVLDLTERKLAEEALRESEERFRTLTQFSFDVYWESDAQHRFIRQDFAEGLADPPAPGSEIGKTRWEVPYLEPDAEAWRKHRETLEAHLPFRDFELARPAADGGKRYISVSGLPVFDKAGRFIGYRGVAQHITERKRAEEALRDMQMDLAHANRVATMGQLTSSIAHEVNQPIAAAVTYALAARRWLRAETPNFREVDDAVSLIVKEGNRAGEVIGRIRALIKKAPARKDAVAINDAILEVIALTRVEAANNSVSERTQLAEGLPHIRGDRVQLQQVLLNLILNAIEAMRDVGEKERELLISTRNEPDGVFVEVRDSGPGFAPADLERVFEAFYTTKPGGLGLGLSICRSIIEAHNGRLWASANGPRGASFQFALPAIANTAS